MEAETTWSKLFTDDDLKAMTGLSRATLWRLRRAGTLPYHKIGQKTFYTQENVRAFFANTARRGVEQPEPQDYSI